MDKKKDGRANNGGKRPNTGPKTNYASMEVKLPKDDKDALKAKYGRGFNQVFRDWVKKIISIII